LQTTKEIITNPFFSKGLPTDNGIDLVSTNVESVRELLKYCPKADRTPLTISPELAKKIGVQNLWFKDERERMGLGSFKALGAAYVIASHAAEVTPMDSPYEVWEKSLNGTTYVTASAGNHGLSLAAGARLFGAKAVIYFSKTVPKSFADKIKSYGADVVIAGNNYEESMLHAQKAAKDNNWILLSDVTWDGYDMGLKVMEGYLAAAAEAYEDCPNIPSHIFLQCGVGGFAASMAAYARKIYGNDPKIIIVEPTKAPVVIESIKAGKAVEVVGDVSNMGRLDCKAPSTRALSSLARTSTHFMTITDEDASECLNELEQHGFETSPSGGAGYAGLIDAVNQNQLELNSSSNVMLFLTEIPA